MLLALGLTACSTHNKAEGTYGSDHPVAVGALGGAALGGAAGAGIGAALGSNVLAGAAIGAGVGAGVGALVGYQEQEAQYKRLAKDGLRVISLGDIVEITIPADTLFYPNEANLTYNALAILNDTLAFINTYGDVKLNVSAHGDTTGTQLHTLDLTRLQAQAVTTYFWTHGKPLNQMDFYGMNHQEPIADEDTPSGEYFNRRIEIMFWKDP